MDDEFKELGLTENQYRVYLELLKYPGQTASQLSKRLSLDRSHTYGILRTLISKGLTTSVVKDSVQVFYCSNPEDLLKEIDEKRNKTAILVEKLKKIKSSDESNDFVEVFEGKKTSRTFIRELLLEKEFLILGGGGELKTLESIRHIYPQYIDELIRKKIHGRIIAGKENVPKLLEILSKSKTTIKTLDRPASQVNMILFADTVVIYDSEKNTLIKIKNQSISKFMKNTFEILWKISK